MIRKKEITETAALDLTRSMILINIMADCAIMEYHNHIFDSDFKNPTIHFKLKTVVDNLKFVRDHVKKNFIKVDPKLQDEVEWDTVLMHEIIQKLIKIDVINLQALLDNLTLAITDAKSFKKQTHEKTNNRRIAFNRNHLCRNND